jgi:hypothetical protein
MTRPKAGKPQTLTAVRVALAHKPPNRCSVELPDGKFYTRPWEPDEKAAYTEANKVTKWVMR